MTDINNWLSQQTVYICPLCKSRIVEQRVSSQSTWDDFDIDKNDLSYSIETEIVHMDPMDSYCQDFFTWFCGHLEDQLAALMRRTVEQFSQHLHAL